MKKISLLLLFSSILTINLFSIDMRGTWVFYVYMCHDVSEIFPDKNADGISKIDFLDKEMAVIYYDNQEYKAFYSEAFSGRSIEFEIKGGKKFTLNLKQSELENVYYFFYRLHGPGNIGKYIDTKYIYVGKFTKEQE